MRRLLRDLLLLLRHESQQLAYGKLEAEGKVKGLEQELAAAQERVRVLDAELHEWQALAMAAGKSGGPAPRPVSATAIEDTRKVLLQQAPSLVGLLDRLPKTTAH